MIIGRLKELLGKLLSIKGLFAIQCSIAFFAGRLEYWIWIVSWLIVIGTREAYKLINIIMGKKWNGKD